MTRDGNTRWKWEKGIRIPTKVQILVFINILNNNNDSLFSKTHFRGACQWRLKLGMKSKSRVV